MKFANLLNQLSYSRATGGLYFIFGSLILWCFADYGVTNDEDGLRLYGNAILAWFYTGFENSVALSYADLKYYGGFFELVAQAITVAALYLGYEGIFEIRHLVNACFGLLGLVYVGRIAALLGGSRAAFWAVLFLLLTPRYFGHSFNNAKDLPFAALQVAALYYLFVLNRDAPVVARKTFFAFGFFWGCALGIRVGAALIGIYTIGLLFVTMYRTTGRGLSFWTDDRWRRFWLWTGLSALLAYCCMLAFWPYAQTAPFSAPFESLQVMTRFPWNRLTYFNGVEYAAGTLPFYYIPVWLLITLPEFYFFAFGFWIFVGGRAVLRNLPAKRVAPVVVLLLFAFFPLVLALLLDSVLYDGLRHFLFILPALAILAGLCMQHVLAVAGKWLRRSLAGLVIVSSILTGYDMVDLHPFQTVYFNRMIGGGLPFASGKFETDYWGNGYRSAAAWIRKRYPDRTSANPLRIMSCDAFMPMEYELNRSNFARDERELLRRFFKMDRSPLKKYLFRDMESPYRNFDLGWIPRPDLFVTTTRFHCHRKIKGKTLHTIKRKGVPLVYIIEPEEIPPEFKKTLHHLPIFVGRTVD